MYANNKKTSAGLTGPSNEDLLCPIRYMLNLLGGKWKLPIVCMLSGETPLRFSSIKRKLGDISNVMLAQSLKELESSGMIHRKQYRQEWNIP
jgi:DNA-binding HxlR family transcriptional regulator